MTTPVPAWLLIVALLVVPAWSLVAVLAGAILHHRASKGLPPVANPLAARVKVQEPHKPTDTPGSKPPPKLRA